MGNKGSMSMRSNDGIREDAGTATGNGPSVDYEKMFDGKTSVETVEPDGLKLTGGYPDGAGTVSYNEV